MYSLLIVEDDQKIAEGIDMVLKRDGRFTSDMASTMQKAIRLLEDPNKKYDLALVDLLLPDGDGSTILHLAQELGVTPIILSALADEYTVSTNILNGAYDYICKPYRSKELIARILNALRKTGKLQSKITIRGLTADLIKGAVFKDGQDLNLTPSEYRLMLLFMNNPNRLFTRDALKEEIWDITGEYIIDNTLTQHIKHLREKVEDDKDEPTLIQTVRGMGYKLYLDEEA